MNCFVLKFKKRDLRDVSNKYLSEIFTDDGPKFDLELISTDEKVIGTHTLVMAMFSEFIHEYLIEFKPASNKICIPLPEFSSFVLRHVVDLIYKGQIMVAAEVKTRVEVALEKLKIKGVVATNPANQQASATAETITTTANPMMMPPPSKLPVQMAKRPNTNLTANKNLSSSVPNLQQIPNGQAYKRELSSNSIQYANNNNPAKRPRPQSVMLDSSSNGIGGLSLDMQKRIGGLSINRVKAAPVSNGIPMQQMDQYDHGIDNMEY